MNRERDERMWVLATKLAQSGEYSTWLQTEQELRALGYSWARLLLDDERTRERIDHMCAKAREEQSNA